MCDRESIINHIGGLSWLLKHKSRSTESVPSTAFRAGTERSRVGSGQALCQPAKCGEVDGPARGPLCRTNPISRPASREVRRCYDKQSQSPYAQIHANTFLVKGLWRKVWMMRPRKQSQCVGPVPQEAGLCFTRERICATRIGARIPGVRPCGKATILERECTGAMPQRRVKRQPGPYSAKGGSHV